MTEGKNSIPDNVAFLKTKADKIPTAMLTTYTANKGFHSRPMGTAEIDAQGNIWFFTNELSAKVNETSIDDKVSVTYADSALHTYLSIKGKAMLVDDKAKMKTLWNPFIHAFFPKGLDDPNLTLLKIETTELEYWESSTSKIVLFFNILKSNLLGEVFDEGQHGTLKL